MLYQTLSDQTSSNKIVYDIIGPCIIGLTCVPNAARCVLRRHFDADASGLNRPLTDVVYSTQTGFRLNRGHYIKGKPPPFDTRFY